MSLFLEKFFKTLINNIPKDKKGIWRLIEAGNVLSKFFDSQMKTNNGKRKRKREGEGKKKKKKEGGKSGRRRGRGISSPRNYD